MIQIPTKMVRIFKQCKYGHIYEPLYLFYSLFLLPHVGLIYINKKNTLNRAATVDVHLRSIIKRSVQRIDTQTQRRQPSWPHKTKQHNQTDIVTCHPSDTPPMCTTPKYSAMRDQMLYFQKHDQISLLLEFLPRLASPPVSSSFLQSFFIKPDMVMVMMMADFCTNSHEPTHIVQESNT